jgi:phosphate acyltransferase
LSRRGERPAPETLATLPVAVDAMGGDKAPADIVEGARRAVDEYGVRVVLVGPPEQVGDTRGLDLVACTEVIAMDEDPATAVRRKKDSSLVCAAELVRDAKASAMVSAGNTGATMASALLRMGRLPGVVRPCIATPLPLLGRTPAVLVDAGANAECTPQMLVQFAQMGAAYVAARFGTESGGPAATETSVGLLSIGEEPSKGTPLVKETHALLAAEKGFEFIGNLEGRDLLPSPADVIVTDGFTGNVALKTLEGSVRFAAAELRAAVTGTRAARIGTLLQRRGLRELASRLDADSYGGAVLLGLAGTVVIAHGASTARAVTSACLLAADLARGQIIEKITQRLGPGRSAGRGGHFLRRPLPARRYPGPGPRRHLAARWPPDFPSGPAGMPDRLSPWPIHNRFSRSGCTTPSSPRSVRSTVTRTR